MSAEEREIVQTKIQLTPGNIFDGQFVESLV